MGDDARREDTVDKEAHDVTSDEEAAETDAVECSDREEAETEEKGPGSHEVAEGDAGVREGTLVVLAVLVTGSLSLSLHWHWEVTDICANNNTNGVSTAARTSTHYDTLYSY